ncbi:expressed unknown protein [Seminavis robusta]|uniref:Uncharacterized protein n=1 Tax=Seminavis robusta TaxID=568900 RepID=A0A9N8DYQ9_9STRA|nr:expressed unknown protein [Seminavis robusta]|eukprot:Sro395_g134120.1 n/a (194) ;mRNA; f:46759-47340
MTASTTTVTPIRRSTRTTKPPETFMASLFSSPNATGANSVDENSVALGPAQTRKRKPNATTSERDDNDVEMAPPPPPIKLCHDPLWSPEEHTQFIEGLRLYADERDATKKWAKIAFHIETKSSQQVRDHAAKPFNSGRWSPEEQSRFRSAVGLYGTADKSDRWKAKVMAIIVQTRNPTQCMQRYRKQLHKEET